MTIFGHCYFIYILCHLLEFNSHLTGDPRSTEITNDYSPSQQNKVQAILLTVITALIICMMFIHTGYLLLPHVTDVLGEQLVQLQ